MSFEAIAQDRLIQSQVQSLPEMVRELSKYEVPPGFRKPASLQGVYKGTYVQMTLVTDE